MRRLARAALRLTGGFAALLLVAVLTLAVAGRWAGPQTTWLMLTERQARGGITRVWTPLERISPDIRQAVLAAEDARFCAHWGFDLEAIRDALEDRAAGKSARGGSTLSQQVAKNLYLWPGRTWLRKGLEAGFTGLIELFWPKDRILEVYLNIAEWGPGVFGVEAAAQRAFGVHAIQIGPAEAARLAAVLPNPLARDPARLSPRHRKRAARIADGAATLAKTGGARCVLE